MRVTPDAGSTYTFGVVGVGAAGTGVKNPELVLHGADGSVVSMDDNSGPGLTSSLTFTAATAGDYYIEVRSLAGVGNAGYGLT